MIAGLWQACVVAVQNKVHLVCSLRYCLKPVCVQDSTERKVTKGMADADEPPPPGEDDHVTAHTSTVSAAADHTQAAYADPAQYGGAPGFPAGAPGFSDYYSAYYSAYYANAYANQPAGEEAAAINMVHHIYSFSSLLSLFFGHQAATVPCVAAVNFVAHFSPAFQQGSILVNHFLWTWLFD